MRTDVVLGLLVLLLLWRQNVMAQRDVIECFNLYNEQHQKLASVKDKNEQRTYDCEAQKVQLECLNRVLVNSGKELEECRVRRQVCADPKGCQELKKRCADRKACIRRQRRCGHDQECYNKQQCINRIECNELRPCDKLGPCIKIKVTEAKKIYLAECEACRRSPWSLLVVVGLILPVSLGHMLTPS